MFKSWEQLEAEATRSARSWRPGAGNQRRRCATLRRQGGRAAQEGHRVPERLTPSLADSNAWTIEGCHSPLWRLVKDGHVAERFLDNRLVVNSEGRLATASGQRADESRLRRLALAPAPRTDPGEAEAEQRQGRGFGHGGGGV